MSLDSSEKLLADYNDVFADIMNVFLYDGERVIKEEELENSKDRSQYKAEGRLHEQERDVSKFYNGNEMRIAFLGIEHQSKDEKYMPLRIISYDGSAYRAQLLNKKTGNGKEQKPYPVITLILYFGVTHWNHGKTIYEVLDIPEKLRMFVSDYKINVIEVAFLKPDQIAKFKSDFGLIADFFVQKRMTGDYCPPNNLPVRHMDAFLKLLSIMVGDERYREIMEEMNMNNLEENNMCEVYDKIEKRGIEKGIQASVVSLYIKGLISSKDAAKELAVSEEDFAGMVSKYKMQQSEAE